MSDTTINWFEIPSNNVADAVGFYARVLGVELGEIPGPDGAPMHVFMGAEGPTGALVAADATDVPGSAGPRVYLNCADIPAALARAAEAGGRIVSEETAIGPYGFIGRFTDLDGNVVALHHN